MKAVTTSFPLDEDGGSQTSRRTCEHGHSGHDEHRDGRDRSAHERSRHEGRSPSRGTSIARNMAAATSTRCGRCGSMAPR